jgi:hypothetical protein
MENTENKQSNSDLKALATVRALTESLARTESFQEARDVIMSTTEDNFAIRLTIGTGYEYPKLIALNRDLVLSIIESTLRLEAARYNELVGMLVSLSKHVLYDENTVSINK